MRVVLWPKFHIIVIYFSNCFARKPKFLVGVYGSAVVIYAAVQNILSEKSSHFVLNLLYIYKGMFFFSFICNRKKQDIGLCSPIEYGINNKRN